MSEALREGGCQLFTNAIFASENLGLKIIKLHFLDKEENLVDYNVHENLVTECSPYMKCELINSSNNVVELKQAELYRADKIEIKVVARFIVQWLYTRDLDWLHIDQCYSVVTSNLHAALLSTFERLEMWDAANLLQDKLWAMTLCHPGKLKLETVANLFENRVEVATLGTYNPVLATLVAYRLFFNRCLTYEEERYIGTVSSERQRYSEIFAEGKCDNFAAAVLIQQMKIMKSDTKDPETYDLCDFHYHPSGHQCTQNGGKYIRKLMTQYDQVQVSRAAKTKPKHNG